MAQNFLRNPGFELGSTAWGTAAEWSIVDDAVNARSGSWVGRFIGNNIARSIVIQQFVPVRPGYAFDMSLWVSGGTAGQAGVRVFWFDADQSVITGSSGDPIAAGGGYTESNATLTAVNNAKFAQFGVLFNTVAAALTGTWYVDDLSVSGPIIETIPANITLSHYRVVPARTLARFDPLVGSAKFSDFNSGMSDKWAGVYTFTPQALGDDLNDLLAFLNRLGKTERFFAYDPDRTTPRGGVVNGLTVDGAVAQGAKVIPITGGTASTTPLVAGDYVEVRDQYFQIQRDVEIGPETTGEMVVWPAVRSTIADGEDVITDNPTMVARVTSDLEFGRSAGQLTSVTISFEEV